MSSNKSAVKGKTYLSVEENLFQCNEVRGEYKDILQTIYKLTIKWRKKQIIGKKKIKKRNQTK